MKKLFFLLATTGLLTACNNEKKDEDKKEEKKEMAKVDLPYKTEYSDFKMGDPNHTKLVLDFYKTWEENRMDDGRAMLNDSVSTNFADGSKFSGTADSLIKMGKNYRAMYSSVKVTIDACMAVHSNDKNEDWVLIWDRSYNTDQKGKLDSTGGHSYWLIKNNKIALWGEMQSKLAASPPPPPVKTK